MIEEIVNKTASIENGDKALIVSFNGLIVNSISGGPVTSPLCLDTFEYNKEVLDLIKEYNPSYLIMACPNDIGMKGMLGNCWVFVCAYLNKGTTYKDAVKGKLKLIEIDNSVALSEINCTADMSFHVNRLQEEGYKVIYLYNDIEDKKKDVVKLGCKAVNIKEFKEMVRKE